MERLEVERSGDSIRQIAVADETILDAVIEAKILPDIDAQPSGNRMVIGAFAEHRGHPSVIEVILIVPETVSSTSH